MKKTKQKASLKKRMQRLIKHDSFWKSIAGFAEGEYKSIALAVICSVITGIAVAVQPLVIK